MAKNEKFGHIEVERRNTSVRLLSIIVPVYNTERYVIDTLQSIAASISDETEIIIVDDGSPDDSAQKIVEWISCNTLNVIFLRKPNGGLGSARNAGASLASGKYIGFFDSDDYAYSHTYMTMVELAEANDLDLIIARAKSFSNVTLRGGWFGDHHVFGNIMDGRDFVVTNARRDGRLFRIEPSSVIRLFRRDFFEKSIGSFPEKLHFEDVLPHAASIARARRIGLLDDYILLYRIDRPGQITASKGVTRFDILVTVDQIARSDYISDLSEQAGACLCGQIARLVHWCAMECPVQLRSEFIRKFLRHVHEMPSHWWRFYQERYAENDGERLFCALTAAKNAGELIALVDGGWEPAAVDEKLAGSMASKQYISIKEQHIHLLRKIKYSLAPNMLVPVRKLKYRSGKL